MKLAIRTAGAAGLARRLERDALPAAAAAAVAEATAELAQTIAEASGAAPEAAGAGATRTVSVRDPAAVARETGSLDTAPAPWLAAAILSLSPRRRR